MGLISCLINQLPRPQPWNHRPRVWSAQQLKEIVLKKGEFRLIGLNKQLKKTIQIGVNPSHGQVVLILVHNIEQSIQMRL